MTGVHQLEQNRQVLPVEGADAVIQSKFVSGFIVRATRPFKESYQFIFSLIFGRNHFKD